MIIPDVNLLVYAYTPAMPHHRRASAWWRAEVERGTPIGVPWMALCGFIRLTTNRRLFDRPLTLPQACDVAQSWFDFANVAPLDPGPRHFELFTSIARDVHAGSDLVTDIHLAAIAIEYGFELYSNDRDFGRFPELRWRNPLAE